ncbi:MAG: hypothetical protein M3R47_17025 [Chloroflexota bacterium]|nr:hypothetical protein [Chloroflexota bacterium]
MKKPKIVVIGSANTDMVVMVKHYLRQVKLFWEISFLRRAAAKARTRQSRLSGWERM